MSIAPRETKCLSSCHARAGQSRLGHFVNTLSCGLTVGVSQNGQRSGGRGRGGRSRALGHVRRRRDHLRDHVAGAHHDHLLARADVLAHDVLLVVQRRQLDRHAAHLDRLEHRVRAQVAELADVPHHLLERASPRSSAGTSTPPPSAGRARPTPSRRCSSRSSTLTTTPSISKSSSPRRRSHSRHCAITSSSPPSTLDARVDAKAVLAQPLQRLRVRPERQALGDAHLVAPDRQRTLGRVRGIELADRAGGGVARVHERRLARFGPALVQRGEVLQRHVHLAAHLHQRRARPRTCSGIAPIVRRLCVTSSPISPLPRVAPRSSTPSR